MNYADSALLTDLYQLTMMQAYFDAGMDHAAVFEFFVRRLPKNRNFLIAAGLEQVLDYIRRVRFTNDEIHWLSNTGLFSRPFLRSLEGFRFRGDVDAMPEGTIFFGDEPIVRVTAPISQAQLVETRVINLLQYQSMVASKAVRCVLAAPDRVLVDFGLRRTHGAEAGLLGSRACYIAGFTATSNVYAARAFNIPISGTMAHSFIQSCDDEEDAFLKFARANPRNTVFLIDTYDTEAGARKVVQIARKLRKEGININGVRLDSGDLAEHARKVRRILDRGGLKDTTIFASGNLDEDALERLSRAKAPIDGYGVGTRVLTSADFPYLECAYKLQEYAGKPRMKLSESKVSWPGIRQVFRQTDPKNGAFISDTIGLATDVQPGTPLLVPVMRGGKLLRRPTPLMRSRERVTEQLSNVPASLRSLHPKSFPVTISKSLQELADRVRRTTAT
jgi:nicotinate phosphoribosyltransferase